VWTLALPVSVSQSDLALRPAFLALLAELIAHAERRAGSSRSVAGEAWTFAEPDVSITGPSGRLELEERAVSGTSAGKEFVAVPSLHGRYRLESSGAVRERIVTIEAEEVLTASQAGSAKESTDSDAEPMPWTDTSAELALLLILLIAAALGLRLWGRLGPRGRSAARRAGARA
jgi:hypothetical protein